MNNKLNTSNKLNTLKKYKKELVKNNYNNKYIRKYNICLYKLYGGNYIISNITKYNNFLNNIKSLLNSLDLILRYGHQNFPMYDKNKLLNKINNKYIPKLSFQCLSFLNNYKFVGEGSNIVLSANIIESCYSQNIFLDKKLNKIAIKLCNSDNFTCNFITEINNSIELSKLVSNNICSNYLLFLGCGTNFYKENINTKNILDSGNLILSTYNRKIINKNLNKNSREAKIMSYELIQEIYKKIHKKKNLNISEFFENYIKNYSFILTNLINGKNMLEIKNYKLTKRMIFEILYSIFCSLEHNNFFSEDIHLDNIMISNDISNVIIKINDKILYFNTCETITFIDYQVINNYTIKEVKTKILGYFTDYIEKDFLDIIEKFLDRIQRMHGEYNYKECINNLYELFEENIIPDINSISGNNKILEYKSKK